MRGGPKVRDRVSEAESASLDVSQYDYDVFVSYAASDDQASEGRPAYVGTICALLQGVAQMQLGRELRVAVCQELPSATVELPVTTADKAALFVAVISPAYADMTVDATAVQRMLEVEAFAAAAGDNKQARAFTAIADPVPDAQLSEHLRGLKPYNLSEDGVLTLPAAVAEMAGDMVEVLLGSTTSEKDEEAPVTRGGAAPKRTVYLAHTDETVRAKRDDLRAELTRRGFRVIPEGPPAEDKGEIAQTAQADLEQAELSVHLFGREYDAAARLECKSAGDKCASSTGFSRYVWIEPDEAPGDPDLADLFEEIESAPKGTHPFRRTSIESFKSSVLTALESEQDTNEIESPERSGPKMVFLDFADADKKWTLRLQQLLGSQPGVDVWLPQLEGDARQIERRNEQYRADCDAVLVVYGEATQDWWLGRTQPRKRSTSTGKAGATAYYLVEPMTVEKKGFKRQDARVIRAGEEFREEDLVEFLVESGLISGSNGSHSSDSSSNEVEG